MSALALLPLVIGTAGPAAAWTPEELWQEWQARRAELPPAPCIGPEELSARLDELVGRLAHEAPGAGLELEVIGESFEGRPIRLLTLGRGERKVLLWSQMHGDEPSATPALLQIASFLVERASGPDPDPAAVEILDRLKLLIVPMLNPDGAERYSRRNAQSIDVNRDALRLATPEGRLLAELRAEYEPILGFNLHDQGRRITVGDSGVLASISVLAVAGDAEGTMTPGRERARRAASAVASAVERFVPGGVGRYDEDFNPRAFGDDLTASGTPVLLIESGGLPPDRPLSELTGLNFVAVLRVLEGLARDDLAGHDPAVYQALGRNRRDAYADVILRGGSILHVGGAVRRAPYRADVAFDYRLTDLETADCTAPRGPSRLPSSSAGSRVVEIGDLHLRGAGRSVDAAGGWIVPSFTVGIEGWPAPEWLSPGALQALAGLGVGRVVWHAPGWRRAETMRAADRWRCPRCPRVEVAARGSVPRAVLEAPPAEPESRRLDHVLAALAPGRRLAELWDVGDPDEGGWRAGARQPWRGAPATFLVLSGVGGQPLAQDSPDEPLDASEIELGQVWLDGIEIAEEGR